MSGDADRPATSGGIMRRRVPMPTTGGIRSATAILCTALIAPVAASRPLAAWEPTMEQLDADCREHLAKARLLPREDPLFELAWYAFVDCADRSIRSHLPKEQEKLRRDLFRLEVPSECSGLDARLREKQLELRTAIARARQVNDFRSTVADRLRQRLVAAGVTASGRHGDTLKHLDSFCGAYPAGLTAEYVTVLVDNEARLGALVDRCPAPAGWTVSCRGAVEVAAPFRSPVACEGEASLEPESVVRTAGGQAEISSPRGGVPAAWVTVQASTEVVLGSYVERGGTIRSFDLELRHGTIRVAIPAGVRASVQTGQQAARADVTFDPGAGTVVYQPAGSRLSVTSEGGRVLVAGGEGSWFVDPGQRLVAVAGRKLE